jgi:hypothetical protein
MTLGSLGGIESRFYGYAPDGPNHSADQTLRDQNSADLVQLFFDVIA